MRYFFLTQDVKLPCTIQFRDFDITGARQLFLKSDSERLNDTTILYLGGNGKEARPDLIQSPVTMFSGHLKDVMDAYEPDLIFKDVVLIHKENSLQYHYVQILMDQLDVISDKTEFYPNQLPKRLILDSQKIGRHNLFLLSGKYRNDPIVSLALAESLMRRKVTGIRFEEVEVE